MAIYAIGDLHLSFGVDKPMDIFGGNWDNYVDKIKVGFEVLGPDDICVLCGDTSWGMSLEESLDDFKFIDALPGKKLLIKGNHDYWWDTVSKMKAFFEKNDIKSIDFLHNNSFVAEGVAICGTRGWLLEDGISSEHNEKITTREASRLRTSLTSAGDITPKYCFFHYPPRFKDLLCSDIIDVMKEFDVTQCYYGHIHGPGHGYATTGNIDGIKYNLVSADYMNFTPKRVV